MITIKHTRLHPIQFRSHRENAFGCNDPDLQRQIRDTFIEAGGYVADRPILLDGSRRVLNGCHRTKAAIDARLPNVPVTIVAGTRKFYDWMDKHFGKVYEDGDMFFYGLPSGKYTLKQLKDRFIKFNKDNHNDSV